MATTELQKHLWIVYDEHAASEGTDEAAVLESFGGQNLNESERDAVAADWAGYVYRYDIDADGKTLTNETLVGPTDRLRARPQEHPHE